MHPCRRICTGFNESHKFPPFDVRIHRVITFRDRQIKPTMAAHYTRLYSVFHETMLFSCLQYHDFDQQTVSFIEPIVIWHGLGTLIISIRHLYESLLVPGIAGHWLGPFCDEKPQRQCEKYG